MNRKIEENKDKIIVLVNEWDPVSLIEAGAPSDEYNDISAPLFNMLNQNKNNNEIIDVLKEILHGYGLVYEDFSEQQKKQFETEVFDLLQKARECIDT